VALLLATAGSLGAPTIASAELGAALSGALGAQRLRVAVTASLPPALWWGRVDHLAVAAVDLRVGALDVRTFDATLDGVRLDPGALYLAHRVTIRSLASATGRITVSQEALSRALASQPSLRDVAITLSPGRVRMAATVSVLDASLPATGDGRLVLRQSGVVDLVLDHLGVAGVSVPDVIAGQVTASLNPVLDLRALPFGLRVVSVVVNDGEVVVDAAAGPH